MTESLDASCISGPGKDYRRQHAAVQRGEEAAAAVGGPCRRCAAKCIEWLLGCFGNVYVDDGGVRCGVFAFQERKAGTPGTKLHVMDILKNRGESAPPFKARE